MPFVRIGTNSLSTYYIKHFKICEQACGYLISLWYVSFAKSNFCISTNPFCIWLWTRMSAMKFPGILKWARRVWTLIDYEIKSPVPVSIRTQRVLSLISMPVDSTSLLRPARATAPAGCTKTPASCASCCCAVRMSVSSTDMMWPWCLRIRCSSRLPPWG